MHSESATGNLNKLDDMRFFWLSLSPACFREALMTSNCEIHIPSTAVSAPEMNILPNSLLQAIASTEFLRAHGRDK